MALKNWGDRQSLFDGWETDANVLRFKNKEVYSLRLVSGFLGLPYHWITYIKKGVARVKMMSEMCAGFDWKKGHFFDDAEDRCKSCEVGFDHSENAVCCAIDIDYLYAGEKDASKVIRVVKWNRRATIQIQNLNRLNSDKDVADDKFGRILQCTYDADAADTANRMQINMGDRLQVRVVGRRVKIRIPRNASSDFAGQIFTYELPELEDLVYAPKRRDTENKFRVLKVEEAKSRWDKLNKKDSDDDRNRKRPAKTRDDEDDEEEEDDRPRRTRKRKKAVKKTAGRKR